MRTYAATLASYLLMASTQAKCPRNLDVTVHLRNVPKMDKDSGSDIFFIFKDKNGKTIKESKPIRDIKTGATVTFPSFTRETDKVQKYSFDLMDKDKGFMNADDEVAVFKNFRFNYEGPGEWKGVHANNPNDAEFERNSRNPFELKIDTQRISPCQNDGTCRDTPGSFNCDCRDGWEGKRCELDVDECAADSYLCGDNGSCNNLPGSYECICNEGWQGERCDQDIDECLVDDPCNDNQVCQNTIGSYKCHCKGGWAGDNCDEDFDECDLNPCDNMPGTVCSTPEFNSFSCQCPALGCAVAVTNPELINDSFFDPTTQAVGTDGYTSGPSDNWDGGDYDNYGLVDIDDRK